MHEIQTINEFGFAEDDKIPAGKFLAEDIFAAQLLVMSGGGTMEPLREERIPDFSSAETLMVRPGKSSTFYGKTPCRSILIGRTGGLGDLTLLTPVLREIKRRWPDVKIAVAAIKELGQSIHNLPFIDEVLSYPVLREVAEKYDGWIWLENAIEKNEDAKTLHSVDCVAKFIGLELPEGTDKRQAYVVTEAERSWVQWAYPRINGIRRICIQTNASARCRTYPMNKTKEVVGQLLKDQWEVFLLGNEGEVKQPDKPIPGLRVISDGHNFRQRAALVESSDCFLGPDSSLLHVAGALSIPAIGLYGPFPWQVRTAYCPTTVTLSRREGYEACSPCFHHSTMRQQFPANCPTAAKGYCGVLEAITPQSIIAAINGQMEKHGKKDDKVVAFKP
jgi:ADP-heptose:LPS heptosyltransferase